MFKKTKNIRGLICGIIGCLCYGSGDWLMMYGDPSYSGKLFWLTSGTSQIPQWRYMLAMALAFPGIVFYGIALFAVQEYIKDEKHKRIYHYLNAFGLTPWIALHLVYVVILSLFAWLNNELPPPMLSEMVSTIPCGIVRHVHGAATPLGKTLRHTCKCFRCACGAWELTPCIYYVP